MNSPFKVGDVSVISLSFVGSVASVTHESFFGYFGTAD